MATNESPNQNPDQIQTNETIVPFQGEDNKVEEGENFNNKESYEVYIIENQEERRKNIKQQIQRFHTFFTVHFVFLFIMLIQILLFPR
jgi:hypothetical protein